MNVLKFLGADQQFFKVAAVSDFFAAGNAVEEILFHTGQHYDLNMLGVFFGALGMQAPKYKLGGGEPHGAMTRAQLAGIKEMFFYQEPCVTWCDETEWVELVDSGWNRLVSPAGADNLVSADELAMDSQGSDISSYGKGAAAASVAQVLLQ